MAKNVKFKLTAVDKTARAFKSVSRGLGSMAKKVVSLQGAIVALGGAAAFKSAIDQFDNFEQALTDVAKVSDINLGQLRSQIEALPKELGSSTELIQAFYQATSSGVTDQAKAMELVVTASKAAKAAHVDQGETIKALTKLMAGFGDEIKSTDSAADLLFKIEKLGQTQFSELVPEVGQLAALSSSMGVTAEEMGGAWAKITQFAGSTSQAATQYQAIISALMKPTAQMTDMLKGLGFAGAQQAIEQLGFVGILEAVQTATGGVSEKLGEMFGRKEAISGFLALAGDGFKGLNDNIQQMEDRAGTADEAFNRWKGTFSAVKEAFKNTIGQFAIEFAEEMMPEVIWAMEKFQYWLEDNKGAIIQWFRDVIDRAWDVYEVFVEKWPEIKKGFYDLKAALVNTWPAVQTTAGYIYRFLDATIGRLERFISLLNKIGQMSGSLAFDVANPFSNEVSDFAGSGGGVTNNFNTSLSSSDVSNISQESARQSSRY